MSFLEDLEDAAQFAARFQKHRAGWKADTLAEAWNAYDRYVDIAALESLQRSLTRQTDTLWMSHWRAGRGAELLQEAGRTQRIGVELGFDQAMARVGEAYRQNYALYEVNTAGLRVETARLDATASAILSGWNELAVDRAALARNTGARGAELDAMADRIEIERGVFNANDAAKMRVFELMKEAIDIEADQLGLSIQARVEALGERTNALIAQSAQFGSRIALQEAEIRESAAVQAGRVAASAADRGGIASSAVTQGAAVARARARALETLGHERRVGVADLAARGAALRAEQVGLTREARTGMAALGVRGAELSAARTGQAGARRAFGAAETVQRAQVGRGRAELQSERETGAAALGARGAALRGQEGVLRAQRGQVGAAGRQEELRYETGQAEAARGAASARQARAEGFVEVAETELRMAEARAERERIRRDIDDTADARAIAKWQRENLPTAPKGSGRSALGLLVGLIKDAVD